MGRVFVFSLTAALNPTLLAAVTVMLTLPSPKRLLLGYLLGAALTSVTCGLLLSLPVARIEHDQHRQAHRQPDH